MATISFDTLAYAKKLEAAGTNREQSEIHAQTLKEYLDMQAAANAADQAKLEEAWRREVATKEDLRDTRSELKEEIQAVRTELKEEIQAVRTELKGDISGLRLEMQTFKSDITANLQKAIQAQTEAMAKNNSQLMAKMHMEMLMAIGILLTAIGIGVGFISWLIQH